jgi:DNA-binding GntR family transcriptional regulator
MKMSPDSLTRSLAEQVADVVADDILSGRYKPGEKVSETELATRLGVSRGPVRDALALLERNMLVTIKARSSTVVNKLTVTELEHVFKIREHVLGIASQYAARNRTGVDLIELRSGLNRLKEALAEQPAMYATLAFPASQIWDLVIESSHSHVVRQGCLHFTGSNIWATALQRKIAADALPAFQKSRFGFWQRLIKEIEAQNEAAAFEAGARLVRNNWKFMKKVFVTVLPTG